MSMAYAGVCLWINIVILYKNTSFGMNGVFFITRLAFYVNLYYFKNDDNKEF